MAGMGHNSGRAPEVLLRRIDVFAELRAACEAAGGQKAWALAHGVTPQNLNDMMNARRPISDAVLTALGWLEDETGINADEFLAGWAVFNGLTPHGVRWIVNIAYRNNEDWLEDLVRAIGDEAMRSPEIGSVTIYGIVA